MDNKQISHGLHLEGSETLIQALDDHIRTCELAKRLTLERDELRRQNAFLRLRYAQMSHAQLDQLRTNLAVAGWEEIRVDVWRNPTGKVYRGCENAWHAMRGKGLT